MRPSNHLPNGANKTDAGNGSKAFCRVSNILRSPSPDPRRWAASHAITPPDQEIERRRPVWDALSSFFLDTELDDEQHRQIAQTIVASGYSPSEIRTILWEEVYPVVESNLRNPAGEWSGFDLDWMQQQILSGLHRHTLPMRIAGTLPYSPTRMVRQEWQELLPFLPEHFRHEPNAANPALQ